MNSINEFSSEKTNLIRSLFGTRKNIFTVCIASVDNPIEAEYPEKENQKRRKDLEEIFSKHRLKYCRIKGKYNNEEIYIVANINIALCEFLFGPEKFNLRSFIFGKIVDNNSIIFTCYQQNNQKQFIALYSSEEIESVEGIKNYFYNYIGLKFQIPFNTFENVIDNISNDLEKDYGWNDEYKKTLEYIALTENITLGHLYRYSCSNLLTEYQEKIRVEKLERLSKNTELYMNDINIF